MDARPRRRLIVVLVAALFLGPGLVEWARLTWRQMQLDRQLTELRARHEALRAQRERLQHDPVYVEGLIRTTFKHARPNEYVIPLSPSSAGE